MLNNWVYFLPIPNQTEAPSTHAMASAKLPALLLRAEGGPNTPPCFPYLIPYKLYLAPSLYESRKSLLVETSLLRPLQHIHDQFQ